MKNNKMIKAFSTFAIVVLMLCVAPVMEHFGVDFGVTAQAAKSGYYTYTVSGGKATITKVDSSISGNVTIPDKLGGYPVTEIGSDAFQLCLIGTLTIGKNIQTVSTDSFMQPFINRFFVVSENKYFSSDSYGCLYSKDKKILVRYPIANMSESYTVSDSVEVIAAGAFVNGMLLKEINLPDSVNTIGGAAFANCILLKKINLPGSVTRIEESTFLNCYMLSEIAIPSKCEYIGKNAFNSCVNLKSISIPKSVGNIGAFAFDGCLSLKQVEIYSRKTTFGESAVCMSNVLLKGDSYIKDVTANLVMMSSCIITGDSSSDEYKQYQQGFLNSVYVYDNYMPYGNIWCYKDSTAESYAIKNGIDYEYLHTYKTKITKATTSKNGKSVKYCTDCDEVASSKTIYKIKSIKLSKTSYTYDGKTKKPSVVVKDSKGNTLKKDTDYTVKYASGRKAVGTYKVQITFKGKYSGSKTLSFKIVLGQVKNVKQNTNYKGLYLSWSKVTGAKGYQIQELKNGKWTDLVRVENGYSKNYIHNKSVRNKVTIRIRGYYFDKNGKYYYGTWSTAKAFTGR